MDSYNFVSDTGLQTFAELYNAKVLSNTKKINDAIIKEFQVTKVDGNGLSSVTATTNDGSTKTVATLYNGIDGKYPTAIATGQAVKDLNDKIGSLGTVYATTSYVDAQIQANKFSGNYNDLTNRPTIPTDYVNLSDAQTIKGVKTFSSVPVCSTKCTSNTQLANKQYVDESIATAVTGALQKSY